MNITKRKGLFLVGVSALLVVTSSFAFAKQSLERQRLDHFFTKVSSLKGSFSQQVYSKKGKKIQSSTGLIYLNRPGKFRWVYKTPDPQTIVGDGRNIWIYDEDLEQVTIKPMNKALSSAPIALLTSKQSPDVQFHVKQLKDKTAGLHWFNLVPRKASKEFKSFKVGMDKSGLRQMVMLDQLGQKTVIQLNAKSNVPIKGNTFYFKIPKGVDVIGKAL